MAQGTHEALRAHPRGGLCKGAQTAHPQARERGQTEVTEWGGGYREVGDPTAVGVKIACQDHDPRGREEEVGVHPVKDLLEDVEVSVGREVHVGVAMGHPCHGEVRGDRAPCGMGDVAGDEQVMVPIKQGGAPAGDLCRGLDGVVGCTASRIRGPDS